MTHHLHGKRGITNDTCVPNWQTENTHHQHSHDSFDTLGSRPNGHYSTDNILKFFQGSPLLNFHANLCEMPSSWSNLSIDWGNGLAKNMQQAIYQTLFNRDDHYIDIILGAIASQITSLTIVYSTVYLGVYQRKHQRATSLAFVSGNHRWPVNSSHKGPVTRKMFPFDDVIRVIVYQNSLISCHW